MYSRVVARINLNAIEYNLKARVAVVTLAQLMAPVRLFEHLVDEQHLTSVMIEFAGKFRDANILHIEIVCVDVKARVVVGRIVLLCILQEECRLSYATGTLNANHAVFPVDFVHQVATDRSLQMLNQVLVRSEKRFHSLEKIAFVLQSYIK